MSVRMQMHRQRWIFHFATAFLQFGSFYSIYLFILCHARLPTSLSLSFRIFILACIYMKFTGFQASDVYLFATVSTFFAIAISFVFIMLLHANAIFSLSRTRSCLFLLLFSAGAVISVRFFLLSLHSFRILPHFSVTHSNEEKSVRISFSLLFLCRLISFALFKISVSIHNR